MDLSGPETSELDGVHVPEVELPRALSGRELAMLPNPAVPFQEAIAVYIQTASILRDLLFMD